METKLEFFIVVFAILFGAYIINYFFAIGLWFTATLSGVRITFMDLMFMRFRKVPQDVMVRSMIMAAKAGVIVRKDELEALHLAGGDIEKVVIGIIYAKNNGIDLSFKDASQMNLGGKDITRELSKR